MEINYEEMRMANKLLETARKSNSIPPDIKDKINLTAVTMGVYVNGREVFRGGHVFASGEKTVRQCDAKSEAFEILSKMGRTNKPVFVHGL